jgi:putative transposase
LSWSGVLLGQHGAVARVMAYITLNPVRARLVDDPAEYCWCGYAERGANGKLRDNERQLADLLKNELGMHDGMLTGTDEVVMLRVWKQFRKALLGHRIQRRGFEIETLADVLNQANKPLELEWPQRLILKARFVTKGVALGSEAFVNGVIEEFSDRLGYRRKHVAQEARAWDQVYCLKRHRKWIG